MTGEEYLLREALRGLWASEVAAADACRQTSLVGQLSALPLRRFLLVVAWALREKFSRKWRRLRLSKEN